MKCFYLKKLLRRITINFKFYILNFTFRIRHTCKFSALLLSRPNER